MWKILKKSCRVMFMIEKEKVIKKIRERIEIADENCRQCAESGETGAAWIYSGKALGLAELLKDIEGME